MRGQRPAPLPLTLQRVLAVAMAFVAGFLMLLAAGAGFLPFRLLAAIHPAVAVAVGAAAFVMLLALLVLALLVLAMLLMALAVLAVAFAFGRVLLVALMLLSGRSGLGGSGSGDQQGDRGGNHLHVILHRIRVVERRIFRRGAAAGVRLPGGFPIRRREIGFRVKRRAAAADGRPVPRPTP